VKQQVIIRIEWPNGIEVREHYLADGQSYAVGDALSTEHGKVIVRSVREDSRGTIHVEARPAGLDPLI